MASQDSDSPTKALSTVSPYLSNDTGTVLSPSIKLLQGLGEVLLFHFYLLVIYYMANKGSRKSYFVIEPHWKFPMKETGKTWRCGDILISWRSWQRQRKVLIYSRSHNKLVAGWGKDCLILTPDRELKASVFPPLNISSLVSYTILKVLRNVAICPLKLCFQLIFTRCFGCISLRCTYSLADV